MSRDEANRNGTQLLEEFERLGVADAVGQETPGRKSAIAEFVRSGETDGEDFLLRYVDTTNRACLYDVETISRSYESDYGALIEALVAISDGLLNDLEIVEIGGELWDDESAPGPSVSLRLGGESYMALLRRLGDWADVKRLLALFNDMVERQEDRRRYQVYNPYGGQDIHIVFLTPDQYEFLRTHGPQEIRPGEGEGAC